MKKGPSDYKILEADRHIKPRLTGGYTIKEERGAELNKLLKYNKQNPSPDKYQTGVLEKMKYNRSSQADLNRHNGPRGKVWKKDDGPSPHSYHDGKRDHYNKQGFVDRSISPHFTVGKAKNNGFLDQV